MCSQYRFLFRRNHHFFVVIFFTSFSIYHHCLKSLMYTGQQSFMNVLNREHTRSCLLSACLSLIESPCGPVLTKHVGRRDVLLFKFCWSTEVWTLHWVNLRVKAHAQDQLRRFWWQPSSFMGGVVLNWEQVKYNSCKGRPGSELIVQYGVDLLAVYFARKFSLNLVIEVKPSSNDV